MARLLACWLVHYNSAWTLHKLEIMTQFPKFLSAHSESNDASCLARAASKNHHIDVEHSETALENTMAATAGISSATHTSSEAVRAPYPLAVEERSKTLKEIT